jgi:hypothetical protein
VAPAAGAEQQAYDPFWALTLITLDVFVIWAVVAHGGAMRESY